MGQPNLLIITTLNLSESSATFSVERAGPGDFDADRDIDGADFLVWQRELGSMDGTFRSDDNDDNNVDAADLALWAAAFGSTAPADATNNLAVPEPVAARLLACGAVLVAFGRRRWPTRPLC